VYLENSAFLTPDYDGKLWRYFDLAKFFSLVLQNRLFFASLSLLRELDPLEGYWSKVDYYTQFPDDKDWDSARQLSDNFAKITFINSWHMNEYESAAMWRIYGEQIAVQTTFKRLITSFPEDDIFASLVRYIDHRSELIHRPNMPTAYAPAMVKSKSYEHEKEVRVLLPDHPRKSLITQEGNNLEKLIEIYPYSGKGIYVRVDLRSMIETIYVAPKLPEWHLDLITNIMERVDLTDIPIRRSTMVEMV